MRVVLASALALSCLNTSLALAQEREWNIDQTDSDVYLVFGVPETDDVGVSFWCKLQSNIIHFYAPETDVKLKIGSRVPFILDVPPKSFRLRGKTSVNEEAGSISLEAEMKSTDAVFAAFEKADYFSVRIGKDKQTYPLQEANFQGFLSACKTP
jgi:hypothetical protein